MCTRPITMRQNDAHGNSIIQTFPCGKCPQCLVDKQNSYKLRLIEEFRNWSHAYFFTLTYSEDTVPRNDLGNTSASVSDLQKWLKRFRIRVERDRLDKEGIPYSYLKFPSVREVCSVRFNYFICAEYAPDGEYVDRNGKLRHSTMRPHYHGVIFSNEDYSVFASLFKDWSDRFGFVHVKEIETSREGRSSVANYVSKYCCKGEFASRAEEIANGEIEKAFIIQSKGIGSSYVDRMSSWHNPFCKQSSHSVSSLEHISVICDRMYVGDGSYKYKMPRYYKDRIYRAVEFKEQQRWNSKLKCYEIKYVKRFTSRNLLSAQIVAECERRHLLANAPLLASFDGLTENGSFSANFDIFGKSPEYVSAQESKVRDKLFKFYRENALRWSSLNL